MKRILSACLLAALCALVLSACAYVDPSITQQSKVYRDAPVEKSRLNLAVQPKSRVYDSPKVLMFPFWISQKMDNHILVGREITRVFNNAWLGEQVFETLSFDPELTYRGPENAVAVGRATGADLVVVGVIPYLYTGGSMDTTALSMQVRIYETRTGTLLFSMEQAARMNAKLPQDWILFTLNTRLSDSPLAEAVGSIARDMAVPLKSWLPPTDEDLGFADNAQGMTRGLLSEGSLLAGMSEDSAASRGMVKTLMDSAGTSKKKGGVRLKVEFDVDSSRIREGSYPLLNELAKALKNDALKGRKILVSGHADSDHTKEYNQKLSERRASSVKAFLVERGGIAAELIRTEGFGEMRPLVPNTSLANKQRNRRVEVRLDK